MKNRGLNSIQKQLKRLLGNNKFKFTSYVLVDSVVRVALFIVQAFVIKSIIDSVIENNNEKLIISLISFVVLVGLISILGPIANYGMVKVIKKVIYRLKHDVFSMLTNLNIRFFDKHTDGDLISITLNDIESIEGLLYSFSSLIFTFLYGITSMIVMFILSWKLTIIIVVVQFAYTFGVKKLSEKLSVYNQERIRKRDDLNQIIVNIVDSLEYIKTSQLERYWKCKFDNLDKSYLKAQSKILRVNKNITSMKILIEGLNLAIIVILGKYALKMDIYEMGSLMAIFQLQSGISLLFASLNRINMDLRMSKASFDRINVILGEPVESEDNSTCKCKEDDEQVLMISNLEFSYSESTRKILSNISFDVRRGETIGIIGESGVGKSTLVKLLLGYYENYNGEIKLYGHEISCIPQCRLRQMITFAPQNTYLFDGSIMENIRFGNLEATEEEVYEAANLTQAQDFILQLCDGYNTIIRNNGQNLSVGQKQRIGLARALISNSDIIILDEPTASLDKITSFDFIEKLKEFCRDKTLILISHDPLLSSSLDRTMDMGKYEYDVS